MRRMFVVLLAVVSLTMALAVSSASAQDLNCSDFNGDQAAAQRTLNENPSDPNGLDGDNDGWACEGVFGYIDGSVPNAFNQDGDTDTGETGSGEATSLPVTGTGTATAAGVSSSLVAALAVMLLIGGAVVSRPTTLRR